MIYGLSSQRFRLPILPEVAQDDDISKSKNLIQVRTHEYSWVRKNIDGRRRNDHEQRH